MKEKIRDLWLKKRREYESQVKSVPFLEPDEFKEVLQAHGFSVVKDMTAKEIEKAWYKLSAIEIEKARIKISLPYGPLTVYHCFRSADEIPEIYQDFELPRDKPVIQIEEDVTGIHTAYANLIISRYEEEKRKHFTENQFENIKAGMIGQTAFQSLLNQWKILYIYDSPAFKWDVHRTFFDFIIRDKDGKTIKLEIKTVLRGAKYFIVKKSIWNEKREPDYIIVLRYLTDFFLLIEGWLRGSEVKELPPVPRRVTPYAEAYGCPLDKLRPWKELEPLIKACAIKV